MKTRYSIAVMLTVSVLLAIALSALSMPVYAATQDSRIETSAKQSYIFKTYLVDDNIRIESKGGSVILTGVVLQESHISLAQETVSGLPGVKNVKNRLEVKGDIPDRNSDLWLVTKVKSTLLFHRSVNAAATEVNVKNGVAILRGTADSQSQKELATEYSRDVEGIKDVVNEMVVAKVVKHHRTAGQKIDDASITAQVKMALLYHRSTSALNTKVETKRGVVTLYGKARNAQEKHLASRFTDDVQGVKSVVNRMVID